MTARDPEGTSGDAPLPPSLWPWRERGLAVDAVPAEAAALVRELPGFASTAECAALRADLGARLPAEGDHGRVVPRGPVAEAVEARILAILRRIYVLDDLLGDHAVLLRLEVGQFHALRADDALRDDDGWRPLPQGARRDVSAFLYLDDAGAGGELWFPQHGLVVAPATGLLVTYPSNRCFLHEVLPVAAGARHALQVWARRASPAAG